ncbi:LpxL/LpxP family Kdo(2)-lipid IV(A) lauroyl/palmitoleoyl acyltransferase [Marinobacterium sedimentorum]|uniref:LpxL/LpxP family Kdo(2)-lipid IV(A) lauroyl/palmitoleoyl acyltransferase n=1 Tax=Marinobacterium sedimentorum TaxID=2927804 RepID=UPI0020C5D4F0|nr:LpxL/LpxP family Kdo(2)-lipid IV(A) lauroyl/palmitoleoyl acyltransferase [Marinobacterium sedimentorum]MCP8686255.1 LpxL/LpxP family Kdo(2)-lipid IV(A) lauroyl/palmitoleoyl acyltransferase [Marinobacterium sedimentorum]
MARKDQSQPPYWHPRFGLTWLGMGLLWLLNRLPYAGQLTLGRTFGKILYLVARGRRHVVEVNVRLCFPELDAEKQRHLTREIFINNGIGVFETAMAWWSPKQWFRHRTVLKGREHLDAALARGKGVILLGAHFSTLDLGGLLFSEFYPVDAMYRRHNNPLMEEIITRSRGRYFGQAIERSDIRSVIRALRKNHIIWYAPDQDFGIKQSVYAPFFGVPAATITATTRLVKLNDSPILMLAQHRLPDDSYELELLPVIEPFPSGNEEADATRINAELERAIRKDPAQYMWVHKRFKTHPRGKNFLYRQAADAVDVHQSDSQ